MGSHAAAADIRYCALSEMAKAYEVMTRLVCLLERLVGVVWQMGSFKKNG